MNLAEPIVLSSTLLMWTTLARTEIKHRWTGAPSSSWSERKNFIKFMAFFGRKYISTDSASVLKTFFLIYIFLIFSASVSLVASSNNLRTLTEVKYNVTKLCF